MEQLVLFIFSVVFAFGAVGAVALRTIVARAKNKNKQPWGIDDWLLCVALLSLVALVVDAGLVFGSVDETQPNDVTGDEDRGFLLTFWLAQIIYHVCMVTAKLSILYTYIRVFTERLATVKFKRTIQAVQFILILYSLGSLTSTIFQCLPVSYAFDYSKHGYCLQRSTLFLAIVVSNIVSDIVILGIPLWVVRKLNMSPRNWCLLCATFTLSCFGLGAAVIRLIADYVAHGDRVSDALLFAFFMTVEPAVVIISACLPWLKPLLKCLVPAKETAIRWRSRFHDRVRRLSCFRGRRGPGGPENIGLGSMNSPRQMEEARNPSSHFLWTHGAEEPTIVSDSMSRYKPRAQPQQSSNSMPIKPSSRLSQALQELDKIEELVKAKELAKAEELDEIAELPTSAPAKDISPKSVRSLRAADCMDLNKPLPPRPLLMVQRNLVNIYTDRMAARRAATDGGADKVFVSVTWPQPAAAKHLSKESTVEFLRPTRYGEETGGPYEPLKLLRSYGLDA